jgi:outer membrane protein OmpA-like peptidoglycan-associated protein
MYGAKRWLAGLLGAALLLSGTGCQDGRDDQIRALQERLRAAEDDNAGLKAQLDDFNRNGGNAAARALQLQQMVDELNRRNNDLQQQLASASNRPVTPTEQDGWIFAGPYAWMDITEEILFDSGKAELKASGRAKLQQVASDLKSKFMGKAYWVIGHTDNDPIKKSAAKWDDNLELSQARARVVALELKSLGIAPSEMIAGGQGEWNPRTPNSSNANKAKNRRVTVMAVDRPQRVTPSALAPVEPGTRG